LKLLVIGVDDVPLKNWLNEVGIDKIFTVVFSNIKCFNPNIIEQINPYINKLFTFGKL
jgi:hypothetical protein